MSNEYVVCEKQDLTAIADAVRSGTGSTATFNVSELSVAASDMIRGGAANAVLYTEQSLTEAQKVQARANIGAVSEADVLLNGLQLKPEFASSTEECTDTSKLYVLPDGYIYAYMTTTTNGKQYTNLLNLGVNENGTTVGYVEGKRWSSSTDAWSAYKDSEYSGQVLTGMFPFKIGQTLRVKGINTSYSYQSANMVKAFDANRNSISSGYVSIYTLTLSYPNELVLSDDMLVFSPTSAVGGIASNMAYIGLSFVLSGNAEDIIITVDEEITEGPITKSEWTNTGRAFVPADYEDRIIELEGNVSDLKEHSNALDNRVASLEASADGSIPAYVLAEAKTVAEKVLDVRNANSFVFGAFSDTHTTGSDASAVGVLHAGMGMDAINNMTQLDMMANFGDVIVSKFDDTYKPGFLHVRKSFAEVIKAVPYIQMQGNHDELSTDTTEEARQKYYAYIGANNAGTVTDYGNKFRNYGYRDFDNYKIRVIYLNTTDVSEGDVTGDVRVSDAQLNWLNTVALNLTDPAWGIIVLSHHPLNWYGLDNLLSALDSYKGKGTGAELIAHFHGHLHNFRIETVGTNNIPTITIPNACFGRNNEYGTYDGYSDEIHTLFGDSDENGVQRQFNKIENSAQDTAFNVVVVNRESKTIRCFNYGAGCDRYIDYVNGYTQQQASIYKIITNLINCTASGATTIKQNGSSSLTITANSGYELADSVTVTGASYTWNKSTGTLVLSNPSGNVTVTVVAVEAVVSPTIINILDTVGYTDNMRFSATNGAEKTDNGCVATGYIPMSDIDWDDTYYAWGAEFNNDNASGKCVAVAYDTNKTVISQGYMDDGTNYCGNLKLHVDENGVLQIRRNGESRPAYFRFSGVGSGANVVVTKNQPPV